MSRRALTRTIGVVLGVLVVATACTGRAGDAAAPLPGGGQGARATVIEVTDGDTLVVAFVDGQEERVRLLGIDTPETVKPDSPVECWGPEASARTKQLLPEGEAVLLQRDAEARDRFGRLLVHLWRQRDGLHVNRILVAEGHAEALVIAPNVAHRAELSAAQAAARAEGLGRWGSCPPDG